jgi:hypothetical protein
VPGEQKAHHLSLVAARELRPQPHIRVLPVGLRC